MFVPQVKQKCGVLTEEMVSSCVSHVGRFGCGLQHFYHQLSLPSLSLSDISILSSYIHLQKLVLAHNKIKNLSCVNHMPYLATLDASYNELSDFFDFQPPKNLKDVDFSHNRMSKMKDLSAYSTITKLNLDNNNFTEITGLEKCNKLTHLSMMHNKISKIQGLDNLPLRYLSLRGNQLERIEGLDNVKSLQALDLSMNNISSLSGLQKLHLLGSIDLHNNQISEIQDCKHIHDLSLLRDLNLQQNPLQEQPDYRLSVIFLLQHLSILDQETVTAKEKVSSVHAYDPPVDVVAARNHMTNLVYQLMQPQMLHDSTMVSPDSPYPILVLTGPRGCGKREVAHRLCQELHEHFGYGVSHTTREPYPGEENQIDYHFVSEEDFQNMFHMGRFIQTMEYGGHSYGLSRDSIEEVAREGLACCLHMELEGVFSLKYSTFEPRYVLLIPTRADTYAGRLKQRGIYTPAQIDAAAARIDLYVDINGQRPGFFDNVIPCDDWEETYLTVKQVVKGYLLLEEEVEMTRESPDDASADEEPSSPLIGSNWATALDLSDPSNRNYLTRIRSELAPAKGPAELASISRREQLVREAIVGRSPGIYSQLFKRSSLTTSQQNQDLSTNWTEDSRSLDRSCAAAIGSVNTSVPGQDSEPLADPLKSDKSPDEADRRSAAASPSSDRRPGSSHRPVLPPIPAGRKTPAPPGSPSPSPRAVAAKVPV